MINFSLYCSDGHEFEAWFRDSGAYDIQKAGGEVTCPLCGSSKIEKALMAPGLGAASVGKRRTADTQQVFQPGDGETQIKSIIKKLRKHVEENADYVGNKFAEEARRMVDRTFSS